jgi:hypothetical protein
MVLEVPSEKFRNAKAERILFYLKALRTGDIGAFVDSYFAGVLGTYTDARTLSRWTGLSQVDFEAQISARVHAGEFIYLKRHGAYRKDKFEQIKAQMLTVIQRVFKENPLKKNINRIELMNLLDLSMDEMLFSDNFQLRFKVAEHFQRAVNIEQLETFIQYGTKLQCILGNCHILSLSVDDWVHARKCSRY